MLTEEARQKRRDADRARYHSSEEVRRKQKEATDRWLTSHPRKYIKDSRRGWTLKYRYKMTIEEYDARLAAQGGHCFLCPATQKDQKRRLAVDHDHLCCPQDSALCGKCNRGILCGNCNRKIGFLEEILSEVTIVAGLDTWTDRAIRYIDSFRLTTS